MKKSNKISIIVIAAVLVPLAVLAAVFSFVKNDDGFNSGAPVFQAQITKEGSYSPYMSSGHGKALVSASNNADKYATFEKEYYKMTSFSVMRGILEWKWFPKAKVEEVFLEKGQIGEIGVEGEQYLVTLDYAEKQTAEIKVKKSGDKDNLNSIKVWDDVYSEGEKITVNFTTVVTVIDPDNPYINDLTLYAFMKDDLTNPENQEFVAYKIVVKANRKRFYQVCDEFFR